MPERFDIYIVYKRRYINTLPFLFFTFDVFTQRNFAAHFFRQAKQQNRVLCHPLGFLQGSQW